MAQKVQVLLTCDLDDDDVPAVETVTFGYDGVTYAFELCEEHLEEFSGVMNGYIASARRAEGAGGGRRRATTSASRESAPRSSRQNVGEIRDWARENGYEVSSRGRIPSEVRQAYEAAQG